MTQTQFSSATTNGATSSLIEKLEALPRYEFNSFKGDMYYVKDDDLRAIIEDAKTEKPEPVSRYKVVPIEPTDAQWQSAFDLFHGQYHEDHMQSNIICIKEMYKAMLFAAPPQPDIVAELVKALEDVLNEIENGTNCYESLDSGDHGCYIGNAINPEGEACMSAEALLAKAKEMMG